MEVKMSPRFKDTHRMTVKRLEENSKTEQAGRVMVVAYV